MLDSLISSKTRIKLLTKFFVNSSNRSWLRNLESEFGESSNAIRLELNRLEQAGLLTANQEGNKKVFSANTTHPMFGDIHNIVLKHLGLDRIVEDVIVKLGKVQKVYLCGDLARGKNSQIVDLIIVGLIDKVYLQGLTDKVEKLINRNIRTLVVESVERLTEMEVYKDESMLLLWDSEQYF